MLSLVASLNDGASSERMKSLIRQRMTNKELDWSIMLDSMNRYQLNWKVNYEENYITMQLVINKTSSVFNQGSDIIALGFSSYGELKSSDFCIIWYDLSHNIHLQDAKTNSENVLQLVDESASYCKLKPSSIEKNYHRRHLDSFENLAITFTRPLDICDQPSQSYYHIDNGTTHLVWFTMRGPILSLDGLDLNALSSKGLHPAMMDHQQMKEKSGQQQQFESGMTQVQLISSDIKPYSQASRDSIHKSHAIKLESFKVPAKETTYQCKLFKLPVKFHAHKYHITKYEAVIQEGNEHVVHHMELFNCININRLQLAELEELHSNGGWFGECGDHLNRPKVTQKCKKVIMAWAMGAHPMEYPPEVGQSIGGADYNPFVMLEIHYNNVQQRDDFVDSSGLLFHYTNKLRQFEAGILEVGLEYTDKYAIPPNQVLPLVGHCVSECTRVGLLGAIGQQTESRDEDGVNLIRLSSSSDQEGIFIFAAQLHTHLTGVASWTEIVREGRISRELQRDDHYSPHFQEIRFLPEPVLFKPGDAMRHYCLYDTRSRSNVTLGGEATTDEMCVTYLHYYPRVDLEVCKSSVDTNALEDYFAYLASEENQPTSQKLEERHLNTASEHMKSVSENYRSIRWNRKRSEELMKFYHDAPLSIQCNKSNGDRFPGFWDGYMLADLYSLNDHQLLKSNASGRRLMSYRGSGYRKRHRQCNKQ